MACEVIYNYLQIVYSRSIERNILSNFTDAVSRTDDLGHKCSHEELS